MKMFNKLMLSAIVVCSFAAPVSAMDTAITTMTKQEKAKSLATNKLFKIAITGKHSERIPALVRAGVDVNIRPTFGSYSCNYAAPLHFAAHHGHIHVVKALLAAGADINILDAYGETALHLATRNNRSLTAQMLIDKGANVNTVEIMLNQTPLHLAAKNGDTQLIKSLLKANANINAVDSRGRTPLHEAVLWGHFQAENHFQASLVLISNGASIDIRDRDGFTPLDYTDWRSLRDNTARRIT